MITRFDHAVIAARDLELAQRLFSESLGFQVYPGGRHTGLGTENRLIRFGLDYLELLGIYDREEVRAAGISREALAEFLVDHEGGMLGFALATDEIDALAARFKRTGLDALGPYAMQRQRPDGVLLRWRLLVPGGTAWRRPWPFFIQWEMDDKERLSFERPGRHPLGAQRVRGVSVVVHDGDDARQLYTTQIGLPVDFEDETDDGPCITYRVGDFTIDVLCPRENSAAGRFLAEAGEGLYQVILQVESMNQSQNVLAERGIVLARGGTEAAPWSIPAAAALGAELVLIGPQD
jgi:hypothetical protein